MSLLRDASRSLRRRPAFLTLTVVTMALGIGATATLFSALDAVLLAPLPYDDSARLIQVRLRTPGGEATGVAVVAAEEFRDAAGTLDGLAMHGPWRRILSGAGKPEELRIERVEAHMLDLLGVRPLIGPGFGPEHRGRGGREDAIILSWPLWQRRFGGDPAVIGTQVQLNEKPHTVVGVMPRAFEFPIDAQVAAWTPLVQPSLTPGTYAYRAEYEAPNYDAVARISPDATMAQAEAELSAIAGALSLAVDYGDAELVGGWSTEVNPMRDAVIGSGRGLEALFGAVLLVMLIASANVANLFLVRGAERQRELSIRHALGASQRELASLLATEGLLVTVLGLVFGIVLAAWLTDLLVLLDPGDLPRWQSIDLDARSLVFTAALAAGASLIGGVLPALLVTRTPSISASADPARAGLSPSRVRIRHALIVGEIVVAFLLFTGATLLLRSYVSLQAVDPGFEPEQVLTARLILDSGRYGSFRDRTRVNLFYEELLARLSAEPEVRAAGLASTLPMSEAGTPLQDTLQRSDAPGIAHVPATVRFATPGYFTALGVSLHGRDFAGTDNQGAAPVAIINRLAARRLFGDGDPVGRTVSNGREELEVIGVIEDMHHESLADDAQPELYEPAATFPWLPGLLVAVRTTGRPEAFAPRLEEIVRALDPLMPVANVAPMSRLVSRSVARERFNTVMLLTLATLGLGLLTIGVYGVMEHGVAQRTREVAVRMALGARRNQIASLILGETLRLVLVGGALGLLLSVVAGNLLRGLLFGIEPHDPLSLAAAGGVLLVTGIMAAARPALRAARVEPMASLKEG